MRISDWSSDVCSSDLRADVAEDDFAIVDPDREPYGGLAGRDAFPVPFVHGAQHRPPGGERVGGVARPGLRRPEGGHHAVAEKLVERFLVLEYPRLEPRVQTAQGREDRKSTRLNSRQ